MGFPLSHSQHTGLPWVQKESSDKGLLWRLNATSFLTLESGLYTTLLQLTSLWDPWIVSAPFTFPRLCSFLHPICCFAPLSFCSCSSLGLQCTLPPPFAPGEVLPLLQAHVKWYDFGGTRGFCLSWTDPLPPFNPQGLWTSLMILIFLGFCYSSPGLVLSLLLE